MFAHLPVDVWLSILQHLQVEDILVLERVSKRFHSFIEQRSIWSDAYKRSLLPRPPGPFPSQSTRDLRSALIKSARLDRCWPPSPTQPPASVLPLDLCKHARHFSLVLDRWLFYTCCPLSNHAHPVDAAASAALTPEILYIDLHSSDKRSYPVACDALPSGISFFTCVGTPSPDPDVDAGGLAFAVVEDRVSRTVRIYRVSLPYDEGENDEQMSSVGPSLKLVKEIAACDVNLRDGAVMLAPGALVVQGHRVHYRQSFAHVWVMHTRTLALWKLPVCATTAMDIPLSQLLSMHFTPTHLLAVLSTRASNDTRDLFSFVPAILEAYPLPLPETCAHDERPLQASHVFRCRPAPALQAQMVSASASRDVGTRCVR
ncbi:hypothetical protein CONPUDRAFT_82469 [Coniophora puteana RWD-64-598 SS2]|uniref:F-box domain-containing protein n=1 Tax=Coniophora puteana (strain RWD-64-598) TaxID=741705 RepID=A0A5M3MR23_CONPW|nr:uncharacterized protein CONPUDRAFT_82469 [Coniophora puteana RWD-64-598 SS2]EIW81609.1 hypothetical protein CONPUDRAFT_82469 [Coniophora puteana RWD-64-598 SS2]